MYKKLFWFIAGIIVIILIFAFDAFAASLFSVYQGGTGTSSPSGILYGLTSDKYQLHTVNIGSNLTFSGGTLSATGGSGSSDDPFTHPASGQSATTSLMVLNGNASTTQLTTTESTYLATTGGNVGIGTTTPAYKLDVNGTTSVKDLIASFPRADVRAYGAVLDGVTDDATAIQNALNANYHVLVPPNKSTVIKSGINIPSGKGLELGVGSAVIYKGPPGAAITLNQSSSIFGHGEIKTASSTWDTTASSTGIMAVNEFPKVDIYRIQGFEYGIYLNGNSYLGVGYGDIHVNWMYNNLHQLHIDTTDPDGWVNQNRIRFEEANESSITRSGFEQSYCVWMDSHSQWEPNTNSITTSCETTQNGFRIAGTYNNFTQLRTELDKGQAQSPIGYSVENTSYGDIPYWNTISNEATTMDWEKDVGGGAKSRSALIFDNPGVLRNFGTGVMADSIKSSNALNISIDRPITVSDSANLLAEKVLNGGFDSDTTNWTARHSGTLDSVAGGVDGNALRITNGAEDYGGASQSFSTTVGHRYSLSLYHKDGTSKALMTVDDGIANFKLVVFATSTAWTQYSYDFTASTTLTEINLYNYAHSTLPGFTSFYDSVSLKEQNGGTIYGGLVNLYSDTASVIPYATTTAVSATSLCLSSSCISSWISAGGPGWASSTDTTSIHFTGSGNVGIGSSSPISRLSVGGNITNTQTHGMYLSPNIFMTGSVQPQADSLYIAPTFSNIISGVDVTDYTGIRISPTLLSASGQATNYYGIYVEPTATAWAANNYGAYFGNSVGVGTTSPGSILSLGDTTNYINFSNTSTSTMAYGLNLKSGCFAINDVCVSGGATYTGTYPITVAGSAISLAFGTTTANTWGAVQTFANNLSFGGAQTAIGTLAYGNLLSYNGTNWVNSATSSLGLLASSTVSSLTANYLPKWSGSTFTNSLIYDNGTNVGIGTTSPWSKLTVNGNYLNPTSSPHGAAPFTITAGNGQPNLNFGFINYSPYGAWMQVQSDVTTGTYYPIFLNPLGGNVGIGTTSPDYLLTVYGSASSTNYYGAGLTTCTTGKVTWSGGRFGCGTDNTGTGGAGTISTSTTPTIGQIPYWTDTGWPSLLGSVATGTITCAGTASCGSGSYVIGDALTITGSGGSGSISTSSSLTAGLLIQSSAWNTIANIATSTLNIDLANTVGTLPVNRGGTGLTSGYNNTAWDNKWDLASSTIGVAYGGTGSTTLSGILKGNGTSAVGTAIASDFPTLNQNTTGLAGTATALASDPTDCAANTWATTIAASGNLTCGAITYAGITAMTSANFAGLISDETGTDKLVYNTAPTLVNPILGYASSTQLTVSGNAWFDGITTMSSTLNLGNATLNFTGLGIQANAENQFLFEGTIPKAFVLDMGSLTTERTFTLPDWPGNFLVGSSTSLNITNSGNVGIGTTTPDYKLTVFGTASTTVQYIGTAFLPNLGTLAGSFLAVNANGQIIATTTPSGGGYNSLADLQTAVSNDFHNLGGTDATGGGGGVGWASSTDITSIQFTGSGVVGIGTSTATSTLDVVGSFHTEEQTLVASTSMSVNFCGSTSNRLKMSVGTANITFTWTNYSACPGKTIILRLWNNSVGLVGSTTFAATNLYWDGYVNPGNNVTDGGMDEFIFNAVSGSSTPFIWGKLNSTLP